MAKKEFETKQKHDILKKVLKQAAKNYEKTVQKEEVVDVDALLEDDLKNT